MWKTGPLSFGGDYHMNDANRLRGRSKEEAERYGKPNINARYITSDPHRYTKEPETLCIICGRPATDAHHWPPLGRSAGGVWNLRTPMGAYELRPSLMALCRRHHEMMHAGEISANWVWDSEQAEAAWWAGAILQEVKAHSPLLYLFGRWRFEWDGGGFEYREGVADDGQRKTFRAAIR